MSEADAPRLLTRPPLPPKRRIINRSLKQREREEPGVDWEHSLQHFAAAVADDLDELHARFIKKNDVTFSAWKQMWKNARMSAAFHVEFWDSSPTNTHKTILQQTLDALVHCVEDNDGAFESTADVTSLIGRMFALYSAFSVQLGVPKHKIDVDPQAWSALLTTNFVMCGPAVSFLPTAAREVRAMMHRLVVEENAFLRCLRGFGPSACHGVRGARVQTVESADSRQDLTSTTDDAKDKVALVEHSAIERLKSLSDHYQELMGRAQSLTSSLTSSNAVSMGRRGRPDLLSSQESSNDGQTLVHALSSYVVYKANAKNRKRNRVARAAAAREVDERNVTLKQAKGDCNDLYLNDCASVEYDQLNISTKSAANVRHEPLKRRDNRSSEACLAQLGSQLHACEQVESMTNLATMNKERPLQVIEISEADSDPLADLERELEQSIDAVSSGTVRQTIPTKVRARQKQFIAHKVPRTNPASTVISRRKQFLAISETSEADSDALADLERELEHSLKPATSETKTTKAENVSPSSLRKRTRDPAPTGIIRIKAAQTAALKLKPAYNMEKNSLVSTRAKIESVASHLSIADSWAVQSTADSDGLAAIQAELDAIPTFTRSEATCNESFVRLPAAEQKQKAKRLTRQSKPSARRQNCKANDFGSKRVRRRRQIQSPDQRTDMKTANSNVQLAQLQAEVNIVRGGKVAKVPRERSMTSETKLRRSSRLSSMASEAGSNALDELEKELKATASALGPVLPLSTTVKTKATSLKRVAKSLPVRTSARSNAKKQRLIVTKTSYKADVDQQKALEAADEQRAWESSTTASKKPSQRSFILSDNGSDGLAELVAELDSTVATQTGSGFQEKYDPPVRRRNSNSTSLKKSTASSKVMESHSLTARSRPLVSVYIQESARLSSLTSDCKSDGLEDIMTELKSASSLNSSSGEYDKALESKKNNSKAKEGESRQSQIENGPKRCRTLRQAPIKLQHSIQDKFCRPVESMNLRSSRRSNCVVFDSDGGELDAAKK